MDPFPATSSSTPSNLPETRAPHEGPHKIFLWEPNGTYLDYCFPNPVHGHFIPPEHLRGAHIRDVLTRGNRATLDRLLFRTWKHQTPQAAWLTFQRDRSRYQAAVQCVWTAQGQVMGLVVDHCQEPLKQSPLRPLSVSPHWPPALLSTLTPQEYLVLQQLHLQPVPGERHPGPSVDEWWAWCVRTGPTNEALAQNMGVTVRTVKAHITRIYLKLQVRSQQQPSTFRAYNHSARPRRK